MQHFRVTSGQYNLCRTIKLHNSITISCNLVSKQFKSFQESKSPEKVTKLIQAKRYAFVAESYVYLP